MKDNFSAASNQYARYRPSYPEEFFAYLGTIRPGSENAWDCGTGNGQVATKLAALFTNVHATDISQAQLDNAARLPNIHYSVQPAEQTSFPDQFFDLVIAAQAVHWFDFERFYAEVRRTAKNNALLVILGYGRLTITKELDSIINELYHTLLGRYWDKERKYVDEEYRTIPFPFEEFATPHFENTYQWTLEHLVGYLNTWSAVKHYLRENGQNPVDLVYGDLKKSWQEAESRVVRFPLLLRAGKIWTSMGHKG